MDDPNLSEPRPDLKARISKMLHTWRATLSSSTESRWSHTLALSQDQRSPDACSSSEPGPGSRPSNPPTSVSVARSSIPCQLGPQNHPRGQDPSPTQDRSSSSPCSRRHIRPASALAYGSRPPPKPYRRPILAGSPGSHPAGQALQSKSSLDFQRHSPKRDLHPWLAMAGSVACADPSSSIEMPSCSTPQSATSSASPTRRRPSKSMHRNPPSAQGAGSASLTLAPSPRPSIPVRRFTLPTAATTSIELVSSRSSKPGDFEQILTARLAEMIQPFLPPLPQQARQWKLLYNLQDDGASLTTLFSSGENPDEGPPYPILLVIQDDDGGVFGAFSNVPLKRVKRGYYGNGACFLWRYNHAVDTMSLYLSTGLNEYYILSESGANIAFGGGNGKFGLWLDEDLYRGHSSSCPTYNNEPLAQHPDFYCHNVEVWTFEL
ncbi:TLD-domain-containing protein [Polychytrium aggregatum]|uniref:TLD-domain-containing protein n=1 Tax=Polychytrium aggregatum TaxID=110093 RepID=UPI0022FEE3BA|nr:TLD-domain-containing protein [Polychytrium aggregatum]KAI9205376.1 TLD-domain-containing protein [Polychytrium aggregatum]